MTDIMAEMKVLEADLVRKLDAVRQFLGAFGETLIIHPAAPPAPAPSISDKTQFGSYGKTVIEAAFYRDSAGRAPE